MPQKVEPSGTTVAADEQRLVDVEYSTSKLSRYDTSQARGVGDVVGRGVVGRGVVGRGVGGIVVGRGVVGSSVGDVVGSGVTSGANFTVVGADVGLLVSSS